MKKFKWTRWPKAKSRWRHSTPYKSPVVMWDSEIVLVKYEEVEGQKVPVYMCRGISTRKIPED
mgnify:FL=1|tara:strand:- start:288 stop:476 length:189 start_codon:yes stop_codon:yes gene_type:complete